MKKRFLAIFVIAGLGILLISCITRGIISGRNRATGAGSDFKRLEKVYDYAKSFYAAGKYDKAIQFFGAVTERSRDKALSSAAFLYLIKSYDAKGDYVNERKTLGEFTKRLSDPVRKADLEKRIEELNIKILFSDAPSEDSFRYKIKPGDTLAKIASRFNTTVELLKKANGLKTDIILPGKFLKVTTEEFNIVVDKSRNLLFLKTADGRTVKTYRVSTGENFSTPSGKFKIEEKMIKPVWYKVGAVVEPTSPDYELGSRWMGLSESGYGIHGTKDPASIGKYITKGCVRMRNADVEELYAIVPGGSKVTIADKI